MTSRSVPDPVASVGLLDEPMRRRLYDYVIGHDAVSREAAAGALGISRVLAAFHLDKLVEGGLLSVSRRRLTGRSGPGAGRPAKLYSRSDREIAVSLPERRYDRPAQAFATGLARLADMVGGEVVAEAVNEPARELGRGTGLAVQRAAGSRGMRRTRQALARQLADDGFEPVADARNGTITLGNCPYRALSDSHRALTCGMNLAWAQGLTEGARATGLQPRLDPQPGRCCVVFSPPT